VSAPEEGGGDPPPDADPPADEEYARAYAAGYEDGARNALREVVQHAARGHTPQEIRMLAEGRLVRLPEEVESKRKGLLAPPRRTAWNSILRPPPPPAAARAWSVPVGGARPAVRPVPGQGLLVREERPARALEILRANATAYPRVVIVSLHAPEVPGLPPGHRLELSPRGAVAPDGSVGRLGLSELGGRLKAPTEASGGALVYIDALEYYVGEEGAETTLRAVHWLLAQMQATGSSLLVSCNTRSMDATNGVRLERAFPTTL
jgi:hypothetical protein